MAIPLTLATMLRSNQKRTAVLWKLAIAICVVHSALRLVGINFIQGMGPKFRTGKSAIGQVRVQLSCANEADIGAEYGEEHLNRFSRTVGMVVGGGIAAGLAVACASAAAPQIGTMQRGTQKTLQYSFETGVSGSAMGAAAGLCAVGGGVGALASMTGGGSPELSVASVGRSTPMASSPPPPPKKPEAEAPKKEAPAEKAAPPPPAPPPLPKPTIEVKGKGENWEAMPKKEMGGKKWTMV